MVHRNFQYNCFSVLSADGYFLYASPAFVRLLALEEQQEFVGRHVDDVLREEAGAGNGKADFYARGASGGLLTYKGSGASYEFHFNQLERNGDYLVGILFLRLAGQAANKPSDQIYARAFYLNPGLSAISLLATGEHLDVNQAWLDAMEYERGEVIGRTASQLQIWEHGTNFRSEVVRMLKENGKISNFEARLRTKSGKLRDIIISAEMIGDFGRELAFFASHDITSIKRAQAELAALNQELEARVEARTAEIEAKRGELATALRRLEEANDAKSRFLSMMSHEIRTPLNAIMGMTDLLMEVSDDPVEAGHLSVIATSSRALKSIIDSVLDFSRIESGHLELDPVEADVEAVMDDVVESLAALAHSKGLDITGRISGAFPEKARLDIEKLRQILTNLLGNAIKYTNSGWVELKSSALVEPGSTILTFEVVDTGVGIQSDDLGKIFERFTQVGELRSERPGSTGLGLSISKGLAGAMGGKIVADSRPGAGSTFRLQLPVEECQPPRSLVSAGRVAILGPETRTKSAILKTLAGIGIQVHPVGMAELSGPGAEPGADCAIVVLPIRPVGRNSSADWHRAAQRLSRRVLLLVPVGTNLYDAYSDFPEPTRVLTYPIGRGSLLFNMFGDTDKAGRTVDKNTIYLSGCRVLVVDDTPENRLVAKNTLEASGALVTTVGSGHKAIEVLQTQGFDLILLDLRMPELDGYETAQRIRRLGGANATIPIMAVSANVGSDIAARITAAGIDGYLTKPFRPVELRRAAKNILRGSAAAQDIVSDVPFGLGKTPVFTDVYLTALLEQADRRIVEDLVSGFIGRTKSQLGVVERAGTALEQAEALHKLASATGAMGLARLAGVVIKYELQIRESDRLLDHDALHWMRGCMMASHLAVEDFIRGLDG